MMDAVYGMFLLVFGWVVDAATNVFGFLFFWLPDDFFADGISALHASLHVYSLALSWLNWFVDIAYFAGVFALAVTATLIWTAWKIFDYIWRKTGEMISFFTPL